jgi:hypothetical protein
VSYRPPPDCKEKNGSNRCHRNLNRTRQRTGACTSSTTVIGVVKHGSGLRPSIDSRPIGRPIPPLSLSVTTPRHNHCDGRKSTVPKRRQRRPQIGLGNRATLPSVPRTQDALLVGRDPELQLSFLVLPLPSFRAKVFELLLALLADDANFPLLRNSEGGTFLDVARWSTRPGPRRASRRILFLIAVPGTTGCPAGTFHALHSACQSQGIDPAVVHHLIELRFDRAVHLERGPAPLRPPSRSDGPVRRFSAVTTPAGRPSLGRSDGP